MNREQYLAKRMWLRGIAPDAGDVETFSRFAGEDEASEPPTISPVPSLADYYLRFHAEGAGNGPGKPN